jgi:hypothetical protein
MVSRKRGAGEAKLLTERPIPASPYLDDRVEAGATYCYTIRRVESLEPPIASADSAEQCLEVKEVVKPLP